MNRKLIHKTRPALVGGVHADRFILVVWVALVADILVLLSMHSSLPDFVPRRSDWHGFRIPQLFHFRSGKQFGSESFADVRLRQIREALHVLDAVAGKGQGASVLLEGSLNSIQTISDASQMLEHRVAESLASNTIDLKSCFDYRETNTETSAPAVVLNKNCKPAEFSSGRGTVVVYNPSRNPRDWCGQRIHPRTAVSFYDVNTCKDSWMNLAVYPPPSLVSPASDDIIEVVTSTSTWLGDTTDTRNVQCDVSCVWHGSPYGTFKIQGTRFSFTQSAEGPQYYPENRIDPNAYKEDRYYSTTSFKSEIPLPYFSWSEYKINSEPVQYENAIKGASFIAHNCASRNNRETLVTDLTKYFRVDSLSGCLHNAEPPIGVEMEDKKLLMRQYLFHLAFENQCEDDYITEKLWGSLEAGVVPVYYGAPNVKDHVPPGSIIVVQDFSSHEALGKHLSEVAASKQLYEKYHEWRQHGINYPESFLRKYNFTHTHSECRTCRWAYAKKNGLGWDHEAQRIVDLRLPRTVCTDKMTGMASLPFKESYVIYDKLTNQYRDGQSRELVLGPTLSSGESPAGQNHEDGDTCSSRGKEHSTLIFEHHELQRSIVEHNGVIDVTIGIKPRHIHGGIHAAPLFFRLESILRSNRAFFAAHDHRSVVSKREYDDSRKVLWQIDEDGMKYIMIQDRESRITVWSDWETQLLSPFDGAIDVLLSEDSNVFPKNEVTYRRIRIIVEDSDRLHYDQDVGNPSFFAKSMAKDFFHPLEVFYRDDH